MAITATAPDQRLAFTNPLFTLSMRVYIEMIGNLVQFMYKIIRNMNHIGLPDAGLGSIIISFVDYDF